MWISTVVTTLLTVISSTDGGRYQFFLDILDKMDPAWVYSKYNSVHTRIQCASLCYQDEGTCSYFGFKDDSCYLLKDTVDRDLCSQDDCIDDGMKVYKWMKEITTTAEPTTTTTSTTTTTTEIPTTTTTIPTTTTTQRTTTTTTEEPTTTTTTAATTTTTEEPTTTTKEPTTTTKEPTTTTTEEPTTTTTEGATTSTTTMKTTTIGAETTTPFNCDPPEGAEAMVECPASNFLLRAMGSRSPFFGDVLAATCTDMSEQVYNDEEEVLTFFSLDGGFTLEAQCPDEHQVVVKFKVCVKNAHLPAITLHCHTLKEPDRIEERYNATSDETKNTLVDCDKNAAFQKAYFMDAGNGLHTRVVFSCLLLHVEDALPEPDKPSPGGP